MTVKDSFREELIKSKNVAESYVVLSIYKNPDLFFDANLEVNDFHTPEWKFFYALARKLIKDEKKKVIDDIVLGLCVSGNKELETRYEMFGGWQTIANGMTFVQEENFDSYLADIKKYNALIRLHDMGFNIKDKFDQFKKMDAEEIQNVLEGALSSVFADIDEGDKVEDLKDGLWETVIDAHNGVSKGFPYASKLLNDLCNGMVLGNLTIVAANSGVGKTFFTLTQLLPNVIEFGEPILLMVNEEEKSKWQRELITWVINNVLDGDFQKTRFYQGEFNSSEMELLKKAVDWLNEKVADGLIRFVNFTTFSMNKAIKVIKKYSSLYNIKYFVLDTLKLDNDDLTQNNNSQAWLQLQQNIVRLYNVIKASNKNLHIWATYQLAKGSVLNRFLTQNNLGMAKNVVDVASTLILLRRAFDSEKEGGRNELSIKTDKGYTKMKQEKEYFVVFVDKNRQGGTHYQIVMEADIGRNIIKDFGTTRVPQEI